MPTVIFEKSKSEDPIVFFGSDSWQRAATRESPDGEKTWLEMGRERKPFTDKTLAHLLDHIAQHPEEVKTFGESLKLGTKDTAAAAWMNKRVAKLDAVIVRAIGGLREGKITIGRALHEEKRILGYGQFEKHVSTILGPVISLRTAQRYMRLARKVDALSESYKLSFLKSASDDLAAGIKVTTNEGRAEVDSISPKNQAKTRINLYRLPLNLDPVDRKAADTLRKSVDWEDAEQAIISELRRLCAKYCTNGDESEDNVEDTSAEV